MYRDAAPIVLCTGTEYGRRSLSLGAVSWFDDEGRPGVPS